MTKKERIFDICIYAVCVGSVVFSVLMPERASKAALSALTLCARRVVPSLFVFTVFAKLLAKRGAYRLFSKLSGGAVCRILGVSESGAAAVFLGLISGYPAGAVIINGFLDCGKMNREEAQRLLPFVSAASPAFLVSSVGSILGDMRIGVSLLCAQTVSAVLLILITRKRGAGKRLAECELPKEPIFSDFIRSVKESGPAIMNACSFITFFYVFSEMLAYIIPCDGVPMVGVIVSGVCEISCGFARLAELPRGLCVYAAGGFMLGFSGISVFMQSAEAVCSHGIDMKKYISAKLIQALLCAVLTALFCTVLT
jgi:hypothetical protein